MADKATCDERSRDTSFHVEYAIDENEQQETENLTHAESVSDETLAERGDDGVAWVCDFYGDETEFIQLMISVNENMFDIHHHISAETAEQLSDMFARAAAVARLRAQTKADRLEAELKAAEEEAERIRQAQGNLFG